MTLTELIAKLEAATGPSRELDAEIAEYFGIDCHECCGYAATLYDEKGLAYGEQCCGNYELKIPTYTSSLDAVRFISNWVLLHASDIGADGLAYVKLIDPAPSPPREASGIHKDLVFAWLIAALEAHAKEKVND